MVWRLDDGQGIQALDQNLLIEALRGDSIYSGCAASDGTGDLEVDVAAGTAIVNGSEVSVSAQTVTLSAGDSDNPRRDVVYIDSNGDAQVSEGTPETKQPIGATRFDAFQPSPNDLSGTDAAVVAEVWVAEDATDIGASDIRDLRLLSSYSIGDLTLTSGDLTDGDGNTVYDQSANAVGTDRVTADSIVADAVGTSELDLTISPTWTGQHMFEADSPNAIPIIVQGAATSPNSADTVEVQYRMLNSNDVQTPYTELQSEIGDPTAGAEDGELNIRVARNGSLEAAAVFNTAEIRLNESGADRDLIVEGGTDENLLFVDAGTDRVGIGEATPGVKLDVEGTMEATTVQFSDEDADGFNFALTEDATSGNLVMTHDDAGDYFELESGSGDITILGNLRTRSNKIIWGDGSEIEEDGSSNLILNPTGGLSVSGGNFAVGDDFQVGLGGLADSDYWFIYDSVKTQFELNSSDIDGMGTDGVIFRVPDGQQDVEFLADISFPNITGTPSFSDHDHSEGGMATIPNTGLTNDSVTVSAGNGLSGGGSVSLGSSTTLNAALDIEDSGTDVASAYGINFGTDLTVVDDTDNTVTVNLSAAASAKTDVEDDGVQVVGSANPLNFAGGYFDVTNPAGDEANIQITAGSIDTTELATDAVTSTEIATDAVGTDEIAANAVGTSEIDLTISPTWTGTHDYSGATMDLPTATTPAQTAEGRVVWDSDDDKLTIGDGTARKTLVNEERTLTGGNGIDAIGDLSTDRTIAISTDAIQTDELDLSITPTWTGLHTFNAGIDFSQSEAQNMARPTNSIADTDSPYTTSGEETLFVDVSSGTVTVTLASADTYAGSQVKVVDTAGNAATNNITINTESTETINGETDAVINSDYEAVTLESDGTNWFIVSSMAGGSTA